jgi:hypothetical protein
VSATDHDRAARSRRAGLAEGRRADSTRRRQRVITAIIAAAAAGEELSASAIARRAPVDRSFLYRHRDLLSQIHTAAEHPAATSGGPAVSRASLRADLANCQDCCKRLTQRARQLEARLSEALGDAVWRATGLGAPDDVEQLTARIMTLEQELADLRLGLDGPGAELAAARAAEPRTDDPAQQSHGRTPSAPPASLGSAPSRQVCRGRSRWAWWGSGR